jgi:hypothetical protein
MSMNGKYKRTFQVLTAASMKMETVSTSEMSVNFYESTRCNTSEDSHLEVEEDMEGNGQDLFHGSSSTRSERLRKNMKTSVRIAGILVMF